MARHDERIGAEQVDPAAGGRVTYAEGEPVVARVDDRRPRRRGGAAAILVLLVVIALVAFLLIRRNSNTPDATRDVTVQSCTAGAAGGKPTASGQILNSTSKSSNNVVRLRFKDANGNAVSNGIAAVNGIATNQTAQWQLTGIQAAKGPVTCELTGVTRTHIPGQ